MRKVFICSPYAGDIETNTANAKRFCRFAALERKANPIAPHLLYTQFLEDGDSVHRELGIKLGLELLEDCTEIWVFGETVTKGMSVEIAEALRLGIPVRRFAGKDLP